MTKQYLWRGLCVIYLVTLALTFTPLITSETIKPELFGLPYTLWVSIAQSIFLILLTYIGTKVHPYKEDDREI